MPKDSPSMAKNKMKRCLVAIYDPYPSKIEVDRLWSFFNSCCAYCGISIDKSSRTGHLDHLVPASEGGSNNIHNHALSCARCNGDEKREESWLTFLEKKSANEQEYIQRKNTIVSWLDLAPSQKHSPQEISAANAIIDEAIKNFESSVSKMRELRAKGT